MAFNAPLPNREAIVIVNGHPSLDFDPITLPVEMSGHGLMVDVFNADVMRLIDSVIELETRPDSLDFTYSLVWSDGYSDVRGMCPLCDQPFPVVEGAPGDEHNEGVRAVTCGCYDG